MSLQEDDTENADKNNALKNNISETISLDKFVYHHDYEIDIEGWFRQVELQKSVDKKSFEENHDIEITEKEVSSDNRVEILSDCSHDSDAESVAKSIRSSSGEKDDSGSDECINSKLLNESDINNIENNTIFIDTCPTNYEDGKLNTNIEDVNTHSTAENYDSNSESNHSSDQEISSIPLTGREVEQELISHNKRRTYSSDSSSSDVIVIDRSKYNNTGAEKDNVESEDSSPLEIETINNAAYDNWPPDVVIVDEDNHELTTDGVKSDVSDKEVHPESIESSHSHSWSQNTKDLDDPFKRYVLLFWYLLRAFKNKNIP